MGYFEINVRPENSRAAEIPSRTVINSEQLFPEC